MSSSTKHAVDRDFLRQLVHYGKRFDSNSEKNEFYRNFFAQHEDLTRLERKRISLVFRKIKLGRRLLFAEKSTELIELLNQATEIHRQPETTDSKSNKEMLALKQRMKMEQNRLLRNVRNQEEHLVRIETMIDRVETLLEKM